MYARQPHIVCTNVKFELSRREILTYSRVWNGELLDIFKVGVEMTSTTVPPLLHLLRKYRHILVCGMNTVS